MLVMTVWNKIFISLLVISGLQCLGFQILVPILPFYSLRFTSSEIQIGIMGASVAFSALVTRPFSAYLADRYSRKKIIILAQAGMAVSGIGLLISRSIYHLTLVRLIQGFMFSIISTTVVTAGLTSIPKEKLGYGSGIMSMTNVGSQAIAPALGIFIADRFGYPILFIFVIFLSVAAAVFALFLRLKQDNLQPGNERAKFSLHDMFAKEMVGLMFLMMAFTSVTSVINNFLLLYGNTTGISGLGYYFTIFALVLILTRFIGGGMIDRHYYGAIVIFSAILCISGLIVLAAATSFLFLAITAVLIGIGYGYANPAVQSEMIRRGGPGRVGAATAMSYVGMDGAYMLMPVIMGAIAENVGYREGFLAFCIPAAIAVAFVLHEWKRRKRML